MSSLSTAEATCAAPEHDLSLRAQQGAAVCRFCGKSLEQKFVDLGPTPLCESFLKPTELTRMEPFYPLCAYVCTTCYLVQVPEAATPQEIYRDYAYYSSYSETWLNHAKAYAGRMTEELGLTGNSQVVELASNDGYLLQYFVARGVPVLGVEPVAHIARVAADRGVPTKIAFFDASVAEELVAAGTQADLLVGNNVLAHVPDLNSFVRGMKSLLKTSGIITMEFPHLVRLAEGRQFDTVYHEHFSYFSFLAAERIFNFHGLTIFDVEELPTHGGSLRIYASHGEEPRHPISSRVLALRASETAAGIETPDFYASFDRLVQETKRRLLECLIHIKRDGGTIVAYGAAGKGSILLNYCAIRTDFVDYAVDRNPHKHGLFIPGVRIPIFEPERIRQTRPDYLLILPWNLKTEIMNQMADIRAWGGRFIVPIPEAVIC